MTTKDEWIPRVAASAALLVAYAVRTLINEPLMV